MGDTAIWLVVWHAVPKTVCRKYWPSTFDAKGFILGPPLRRPTGPFFSIPSSQGPLVGYLQIEGIWLVRSEGFTDGQDDSMLITPENVSSLGCQP